MPIAQIRWRWSNPRDGYALLLPGAFEKWHRGKNLGLDLVEVSWDGRPLTSREMEKLNLFIQADGAWRASLLDHFEAHRLIADVLGRRMPVIARLGQAGGGRWASGTLAEVVLGD